MLRQGDLLIVEINDIPHRALKKVDRVLAEGEKTGHRHELDGGEVFEQNGRLFVDIPSEKGAELTHPDHASVTLKPGKYRVIRQREYEPGNWRHVQD